MSSRLPNSDCIPWLAVLVLECLAIVILNIITIIVFVKHRQLRRRSAFLIIHLTIVDLLVGAVSGRSLLFSGPPAVFALINFGEPSFALSVVRHPKAKCGI